MGKLLYLLLVPPPLLLLLLPPLLRFFPSPWLQRPVVYLGVIVSSEGERLRANKRYRPLGGVGPTRALTLVSADTTDGWL